MPLGPLAENAEKAGGNAPAKHDTELTAQPVPPAPRRGIEAGTSEVLVGIVCGLASEVEALGRWENDRRISVAVTGGRPDVAESEARRLVEAGCRILLSWGIAGGLDPNLAPGSLVTAEAVAAPGGDILDALPLAGLGITAVIAGSDRIVATRTAKTVLGGRTGASALDMESHSVGLVAREAGIPFAVLRAVADPATRSIPQAFHDAVDARGRPRGLMVAGRMLGSPGLIGPAMRLARDSRRAHKALRIAADAAMEAALALAQKQG